MKRIFTKRIACHACGGRFTITSAASKFCKREECIKQRRKAVRLERHLALREGAKIERAARNVIDAFEALGRAKDDPGSFVRARLDCVITMEELKAALGPGLRKGT